MNNQQQFFQTELQQTQQQFQAMMQQQLQFQQHVLAAQHAAKIDNGKKDPPKFIGKANEDLELWIFTIEQYYGSYAEEMVANDSRFVDLVSPNLGPEAMTWYRAFKNDMNLAPRTWASFKTAIRSRFRDSDFDYKCFTKLYNLKPTGSQEDY